MLSNVDNNDSNIRSKWLKKLLEDIVLTSAVIAGLIGGVLINIFEDILPFYSACFLKVGIASLVYRFLGGITQSTSITITGFKLGLSLAALIACMFLINDILVKQRKQK